DLLAADASAQLDGAQGGKIALPIHTLVSTIGCGRTLSHECHRAAAKRQSSAPGAAGTEDGRRTPAPKCRSQQTKSRQRPGAKAYGRRLPRPVARQALD